MKHLILIAILVGSGALMRSGRCQETVLVPDDFLEIQDAIDAAEDGWTILVRPGTYLVNLDFLGKAITLRSTDGPEVTVLDGSQPADPDLGSVVMFVNGEGSATMLEGFTVTGGMGSTWTDPWGSVRSGGGGLFVYDSTPVIRNCVIEANTAPRGGGIYCGYANVDVEDCALQNNSARLT